MLAGTITIIKMYNEETGAGFFGAFTGYIIILIISIWLIYSANKEQIGPINLTGSLRYNQANDNSKKKLSAVEQKQSIEILKEKDLLSETEYEEKMKIIDGKIILEKLYTSTDYLNLKNLYENEILTQDEFNLKVETIKKRITHDLNPNRNLENDEDVISNNEINIKNGDKPSDFYGKWISENAEIHFYEEYGIQRIKMNWNNGIKRNGHWYLTDSNLIASLYKTFGVEEVIFEIEKFTPNSFIYLIDGKRYTAIKN